MYSLKDVATSKLFYLIPNKEYVVGRKNAEIILANDQSISRKHAVIKTENNSVKLLDCGSKYGTFYNNIKIEANKEIEVNERNVIKFGVFQSVFILEKIKIATTGSGLSNNQKRSLKQNLDKFGGILLNNWDSTCTHLTLQEIVLSVKVLQALIDDKPFVNLEYWDKFVENVNTNRPLPKVDDFKPVLKESFIESSALKVNPKRKTLFVGKTFVFPNEKIKLRMEDLIKKTGGNCISWDKQQPSMLEITDSPNKFIFIRTDEVTEISETLKVIQDNISRSGRRIIPIQEIARAILMCSCEQDCNPLFDRVASVFLKKEGNVPVEVFPLALETQTQDPVSQPLQELVVPGSLDSNAEMLLPKKSNNNSYDLFSFPSTSGVASTSAQKRASEDREVNPFKKMRTESVVKNKQLETFNESKKRKADEDLSTQPKKAFLKENPFATFKVNKNTNKKVQPDNPFVKLRVKQEKHSDDNPFMKIKKQDITDEREKIELKNKPSTLPLASSPLGYVKKRNTDLSKIKWLSKYCKSEEFNVSEEFKEIYNKFKNTVVIEVIPPSATRIYLSDSIDASHNTTNEKNVKNFKKFKKVRPLRPQTNIVLTSVPMLPNDSQNNEITISSDEEDEVPRRVVKKVNKSRRFDF